MVSVACGYCNLWFLAMLTQQPAGAWLKDPAAARSGLHLGLCRILQEYSCVYQKTAHICSESVH